MWTGFDCCLGNIKLSNQTMAEHDHEIKRNVQHRRKTSVWPRVVPGTRHSGFLSQRATVQQHDSAARYRALIDLMEENKRWQKQANTTTSKMDNTQVLEATSTITIRAVRFYWRYRWVKWSRWLTWHPAITMSYTRSLEPGVSPDDWAWPPCVPFTPGWWLQTEVAPRQTVTL